MADEGGSGAHSVLPLAGGVDEATVPGFLARVRELLARPGIRRLTLDLEQLDFLDSSGLGLLVSINTQARTREVELQLRRVPPRAMQLLRRAGLADVLQIVD